MNPLVIFARLIFPASILKWPLVGGAVAIWLDNLDWHTKNLFGIAPIGDYQTIDKILDIYYLSLLAFVALKLTNKTIRNILTFLFIYRFIGFVLFEATQTRFLLFIFPNIFESFFFFYYILKSVARYEPKLPPFIIGVFLLIVAIPKMLQEYEIHIIQKDLYINVFGFSYSFEGTLHQIIYIILFSVLFGLLYRKASRKI